LRIKTLWGTKMILFALSTFFTVMSNIFVIGEAEFFYHKNKAIELYGPCEWKYVGKDTEITNPALKLFPPVGEPYVLYNQVCENGPDKK